MMYVFHTNYIIVYSHLLYQPTHLAYIIAAANLHAFNYGLKGNPDTAVYKKVADSVIVPEFTPRSGVKVQVTETDAPQQEGSGGKQLTPFNLHKLLSSFVF